MKTDVWLTKRYFIFCLLLLSISVFLVPEKGYYYDIMFWKTWSKQIFYQGIGQVYSANCDYLPMFHYILWMFGKIMGSAERIENNIHFLKIITFIFQLFAGFYFLKILTKFINNSEKVFFYVLFYVLNIAILYNNFIWGQVDTIMTCFIFISFYFASKRKVLQALVFIIVAINFKLQSIIFLPIIGLLILPTVIKEFNVKKMIAWIGIPLVLQCIICLPFILDGTVVKVWNVVMESNGKYPMVSLNAFNIWELLIQDNLMENPDNLEFLGITLNHWGLLMFFGMSFIVLLPLLKNTFRTINKSTDDYLPYHKVLLIAALIPLLFFYLNTQMHERYSHPSLIFLLLYAIINRHPAPAVLGCSAYLLNQVFVLQFDGIYQRIAIIPISISVMYLLTITWLTMILYDLNFIKFWKKKTTHSLFPIPTELSEIQA